jgi:hypothetical protein
MPPIIKCRGMSWPMHRVRKHLVSVNYRSNAWVGWSDFYVAHWGVNRGRFLSIVSSAAHPRWPLQPPSWISFPSIRGSTSAWVNWSNFSVAHWGWLEEGSFQWSAPPLGGTTHPRWSPSWIWFPLIRGQAPGSIDPIFLRLIGGD